MTVLVSGCNTPLSDMITPELLKAGRGCPGVDNEVLLLIRAERHLVEARVAERRTAILERRVLLTLMVVLFVVALMFAALQVVAGAVGGAVSALIALLSLVCPPRAGAQAAPLVDDV